MIGTMAKIAVSNPWFAARMAMSNLLATISTTGSGTGSGLSVESIVKGAQEQGEVSATKGLESKAQELGGGAWRILLIIGAVLILVGLGMAGLKLFFSNSSTRNEAKGDILWKIIGAVFFFGVGAMVLVLFNVGVGLFSQ